MRDMSRFIKPMAYAIAALLVTGGGYLGYRSFEKETGTYQVTAYFTKAIGLFPNSDVDILGVPVGTIDSVEPVGSKVKVVMSIEEEYKVPAGATAQIVPISVISDRYVQLSPVYQGGEALADGAEIPLENTYIPAELDDVFKQLKKLLDAIEPGKSGEPGVLGDLIVQLDQTLQDREQDLKGTLINGSKLTATLADAQGDISGLLTNLDDLFGRLATRANSLGTLNRNFALVMAALNESRNDLEGTLVNLGDLTGEVASLVKQHGDRLGGDLELAARIVKTILDNRASVEESLVWLPILGRGIDQAYNPMVDSIDVRDNANAKLQCKILRPLPPGPVKDALTELCRAETGEPGGGGGEPRASRAVSEGARPVTILKKLDCDEGVRKVTKQLRRLEDAGLPTELSQELLKPLKKKIRQLKKRCDDLGEAIDDPDVLEQLEDIGSIPEIEPPIDNDALTGSAASSPVPPSETPSAWQNLSSWIGGFLGYVGVGR